MSSDCTQRVTQLKAQYPQLHVQSSSPYLVYLHSIIRDVNTSRVDFVFYGDQLLRLLMEFALSTLPYSPKIVTTPTSKQFDGVQLSREVIGVSIMRSGEAMEQALRSVIRNVRIGKILIQRDESLPNKPAKFFYSKMPSSLNECSILLLDPMLATGNSSILAIKQMVEQYKIKEEDITYVNLISAPEGIHAIVKAFPGVKIVTGMVDEGLNSHKYIVPGVGDFGDRYFGT